MSILLRDQSLFSFHFASLCVVLLPLILMTVCVCVCMKRLDCFLLEIVKCFDYYRIKWMAIMSETLSDFNNTGNAKNFASRVCVRSSKGSVDVFFQCFASFQEYCW